MLSVPASLSAFESLALQSIIAVSFALTGLSVLMAVFIVIKRAWRQRQAGRREKRRREITSFLHHLLSAEDIPFAGGEMPFEKKDMPLVFDAALSVIRGIKGSDAVRVVSRLNGWGMEAYAHGILSAPSRAEKIRALAYLSRCSDEKSIEDILAASASDDRYVQLAALRALAERQAVEHLGLMLSRMEAGRQRNTLILTEVLTRFGEGAVPDLLHQAQFGSVLEMRIAAINALGAIGSPDAVDTLIALAGALETHAEITAKSLQALSRLGDRRAEGVIIRNLSSTEKGIRVQAARAAGALALSEALPQLAALLEDDDWWVRFRAGEALARLGRPGQAVLEARSRDRPQKDEAPIARLVLKEKGL